MKSENLMELRPGDGSAVEIASALARATEMRAAIETNIATLLAEKPRLLLEGSAKEVTTNHASVVQAREALETVDGMLAAMQTLHADAKRREQIATLQTEYDALEIEQNSRAFVEFYRDRYPALARKIADGMELEAKVAAATSRAVRIAEELRALGAPAPTIPHPTAIAVGTMLDNRMLSDLVRLPGIGGAPCVGYEYYDVEVKHEREVVDYDNPILPPKNTISFGGVPVVGVGYRTKKVQIVEKRTERKLARTDTPIWPADVRAWSAQR